MDNKRLQIAFLSAADARDKKSWSGTPYYMAKSLEKHVGDIHYIGPVNLKVNIFCGRLLSFLSQKLLGKRYDYLHSRSLAKKYARIFSDRLKEREYDLIFAPAASTFISFLETNTPIIYSSDSTFRNMLNYYPGYTHLLKTSLKQGMEIESKALSHASLALYPSAWAANSALKDYNIDPAKVHIIPYGANTENIPPKESIHSKKRSKVCRLLFLGVDWERKGGPIAFETLISLLQQNIEVEMTVCGCIPPEAFNHKCIKIIPFLNKNKEKDRKEFYKLLLHSDFLLLPSRNECYGIVFCEASAFGLPSIASDTGGISGAIKEGENGFLLPLSARGQNYASLIASLFADEKSYNALVQKSRTLYETSLNWDAWAQKVKELVTQLVSK